MFGAGWRCVMEVDTVGFKLGERKGLREGFERIVGICWKSLKPQEVNSRQLKVENKGA